MDIDYPATLAADLLQRAETTVSVSEKTALLEQVVALGDAPALRVSVGWAKLRLAHLEKKPAERQRRYAGIVAEYRDAADAGLAPVVLDAALGMVRFIRDKKESLALCDEMLARYAGATGRAESLLNHFAAHRDLLTRHSPESRAAVDAELAAALTEPEFFSPSKISRLLSRRFDFRDAAARPLAREWCLNEAEKTTRPGVAAGLLSLAALYAPKAEKVGTYEEIIRRYADSDDAACVREAAEAVLQLARLAGESERVVPALDELLTKRRGLLYSGLTAALLLCRASFAADAAEKEKLYDEVVNLPEDGDGTIVERVLFFHQLSHHRNRALGEAAALTDSVEAYLRYLKNPPLAFAGPSRDYLTLVEYCRLAEEETNPRRRMALFDAALARFLPPPHARNVAGALAGVLQRKADATRDPDAARALYRQALAVSAAEEDAPSSPGPFLAPYLGLLRIARDRNEKTELYARLVELCRDHVHRSHEAARFALERASLLDEPERENAFARILDAHRDTDRQDELRLLADTLRMRAAREAGGDFGPPDALPEEDGVFPAEARARALVRRIAALADPSFTPDALAEVSRHSANAFSVVSSASRLAQKCLIPENKQAIRNILEKYYGVDTDQGALIAMDQMRRGVG